MLLATLENNVTMVFPKELGMILLKLLKTNQNQEQTQRTELYQVFNGAFVQGV